jgi:hypothetical protein
MVANLSEKLIIASDQNGGGSPGEAGEDAGKNGHAEVF